jgi:outer membrane lipoprotein carrier protein
MGPGSAVRLLLLACSILTAIVSLSAEAPAVLQLLESRYASARTLQVKFLERYSECGRFVRAEAGTAYFLRPGKMRWEYVVPEKNTFLVDGKYVWFYSPADRTATRMPAKQSEDWRTPIAFLTTHMKLSRLCESVELEKESAAAQQGDTVFRCELRPEQHSSGHAEADSAKGSDSSHAVSFEVSPDGELKRIVVRQEAEIELEFSFTNWEWNPQLDKEIFEFVPPRGVAIVNGLLPETPGLRQ